MIFDPRFTPKNYSPAQLQITPSDTTEVRDPGATHIVPSSPAMHLLRSPANLLSLQSICGNREIQRLLAKEHAPPVLRRQSQQVPSQPHHVQPTHTLGTTSKGLIHRDNKGIQRYDEAQLKIAQNYWEGIRDKLVSEPELGLQPEFNYFIEELIASQKSEKDHDPQATEVLVKAVSEKIMQIPKLCFCEKSSPCYESIKKLLGKQQNTGYNNNLLHSQGRKRKISATGFDKDSINIENKRKTRSTGKPVLSKENLLCPTLNFSVRIPQSSDKHQKLDAVKSIGFEQDATLIMSEIAKNTNIPSDMAIYYDFKQKVRDKYRFIPRGKNKLQVGNFVQDKNFRPPYEDKTGVIQLGKHQINFHDSPGWTRAPGKGGDRRIGEGAWLENAVFEFKWEISLRKNNPQNWSSGVWTSDTVKLEVTSDYNPEDGSPIEYIIPTSPRIWEVDIPE